MKDEMASSARCQYREAVQSSRRGKSKFVVLVVIGLITVAMSAAAIIPEAESTDDLGSIATHTVQKGDVLVSVTEQGTLESSNNTEIKCKVRGDNTIISVVESGTTVKPGDDLVRLDTLLIEEEISERTKFAHLASADVARSKADVANAELAISEYLEGRFLSELAELKKDLAIGESQLVNAKNKLSHARMLAESEYASELEVEERQFAVEKANLTLKLTQTRIDVLKRFTKREELAQLHGELKAAKAKYEADKERAYADQQRLARAKEEFEFCVIKADRGGLVIYPKGKEWEEAPDIEEGATVHKNQVLLLMPDLSRMQVKVGIHESVIGRIKPGLAAKVALPSKTLEGELSSVASMAKPAGWWTGNVVKYDTLIELPSESGLKPGMSVEVEVILARYENVLKVPTAAVLETSGGHVCWVKQGDVVQRRPLQIGDSSDMFLVVEAGLEEGDQVILNPLAYLKEAQDEAASMIDPSKQRKPVLDEI